MSYVLLGLMVVAAAANVVTLVNVYRLTLVAGRLLRHPVSRLGQGTERRRR